MGVAYLEDLKDLDVLDDLDDLKDLGDLRDNPIFRGTRTAILHSSRYAYTSNNNTYNLYY